MTKRDNFATFFTAEAFLFCSVKTATERFNLSDLLFSLHCYMPLALLCTQQLLPIKIGTIIPRASMLLAEKEKNIRLQLVIFLFGLVILSFIRLTTFLSAFRWKRMFEKCQQSVLCTVRYLMYPSVVMSSEKTILWGCIDKNILLDLKSFWLNLGTIFTYDVETWVIDILWLLSKVQSYSNPEFLSSIIFLLKFTNWSISMPIIIDYNRVAYETNFNKKCHWFFVQIYS